MKYFVTGSTGFIGMELTKKLANSGKQVHILVRSAMKAEMLRHPNIIIFNGDITDQDAVTAAMQGCTHVFHLAALAKASSKNPDDFTRVNVDGTRNVLEAARLNNVAKVVFTSSAGTLLPSNSNDDVDEQSEKPAACWTEYARTKALAENICMEYIKKGMGIVIVSPSRVYGPGQMNESNAATKIIDLFNKGKWRLIPGNGETFGNYVFIDDVVNGHLLAMEKGLCGNTYILGGSNLTFNEFFNTLKKVTGRNQLLFKAPYPILWSIASVLALFFGLTGKEPPITPGWIKRYLQHRRLSVNKAVTDLGYSVTPFATGAKKTVEWLNQSQKLNGN